MGRRLYVVGVVVVLAVALLVGTGPAQAAPAAPARVDPARVDPGPADPVRPAPIRIDGGHDDRARAMPARRVWSKTTIRTWVNVPAGMKWSVDTALRTWNRTGSRMTFVKVSSSANADLRIQLGETNGALGVASYRIRTTYTCCPTRRKVTFDRFLVRLTSSLMSRSTWSYQLSPAEIKVAAASVVAHELGHILGMDHAPDGCQVMAPYIDPWSCPMFVTDKPGHYRCRRVVDLPALSMVVRLYGGTATFGEGTACPLAPAAPLVGLDVALNGDDGAALTWTPPATVPAGARVLAYLGSGTTCRALTPGGVHLATYGPPDAQASLTAGRIVVPAEVDLEETCVLARVVNSVEASRESEQQVLVLRVPEPDPPVVGAGHLLGSWSTSNEGIRIDSSDLVLAAGQELAMGLGVDGQCPSDPAAFQTVDVRPGQPTVSYHWGEQVDAGCVGVAIRHRGRLSQPVEVHFASEPVPGVPPATNARERWLGYPDADVLSFTVDGPFPQDVVLVGGAQCPSVTWDGETDPRAFVASLSADETEAQLSWDTENGPLGCITAYAINGAGQVGPGAQLPVRTVVAPVKPVLSSVARGTSVLDRDQLFFTVDHDRAATDLVTVFDAVCHTTWVVDAGWTYQATTPQEVVVGSGRYSDWIGSDGGCLSAFTVNGKGQYSAGATALVANAL